MFVYNYHCVSYVSLCSAVAMQKLALNGPSEFLRTADNTEQLFSSQRWLENAENVRELNIDDNLIGEMGGREILHGLQSRKEGNVVKLLIFTRS